jgi:hypothetical protein
MILFQNTLKPQDRWGKKDAFAPKIRILQAGGLAQAVGYLLSKGKALSSNSSTLEFSELPAH